MLSIGLMSGTSMDGIDAALIETDGTAALIRPIDHTYIPYENEFRIILRQAEADVVATNGGLNSLGSVDNSFHSRKSDQIGQNGRDTSFRETKCQQTLELTTLTHESTRKHAEAVSTLLKKTGILAADIGVIGFHGQTLLHRPKQGFSINIGDGQLLANLTGIPVINNFRQADILAGGQGAPFAPLYHQALAVSHGYLPAAVVNCGGIANITLIHGKDPRDVIAFDTGPGNALTDRLVRERTQNREYMDRDGNYGLNGTVHLDTLEHLRTDAVRQQHQNYLLLPPPKSLDTHDLILPPCLNSLSMEDACATLEMFTADCIVQSLSLIDLPPPAHWILAGGGWKNPCILQFLKQLLYERVESSVGIFTAGELGQNPDALEAELFAWLAVRSLKKMPLSMPKTTGVPKPMTGGEYYRPFNEENAAKTL